MNANSQIFATTRRLIDSIGAALRKSGEAGPAEVVRRLAEQRMDEADFLQPLPIALPVIHYLPACIGEAGIFDASFAQGIAAVSAHLRWRQTAAYTDDVLGEGFKANYGWTQLIGPNGFFKGDDFLLGLLMLGPHRHYPDHFHPAPELYLPLTSGTLWRCEPGPLAQKPAGSLIWHLPNQIHAIRTVEQPMLALWTWTRDTATPARLVDEARTVSKT